MAREVEAGEGAREVEDAEETELRQTPTTAKTTPSSFSQANVSRRKSRLKRKTQTTDELYIPLEIETDVDGSPIDLNQKYVDEQ